MTDIGHNNPPPHLEHIEQAELLKEEAKAWLDGSEIKTEAEAEAVAKLITLASKIDKDAEKARKAVTQPLDDQKKAIMADFKPVADTCALITVAAKKAMTVYLNRKAAEKAEADRLERERLAAERERIMRESAVAQSLEDIEAKQAEIEAHLKAEKAAERASGQSVNVKGVGRTVAMVTRYDIAIEDEKALAGWFWKHKRAELLEFMRSIALGEVRAASGNATIDGVRVISEKVAR